MKVDWDALTAHLVEPLTFTIAYVNPNVAEKRVGENNTQLFALYWPGVDESILQRITSVVNTTILLIVIAVVAGLPDHSWKIRQLLGCLEETNGDGCPHAHDIPPSYDDNTTAG